MKKTGEETTMTEEVHKILELENRYMELTQPIRRSSNSDSFRGGK
jgi:hypothetical protein